MRTVLLYIFAFFYTITLVGQQESKTLILKLNSTDDKQVVEIEENYKIELIPLFENHYNKRHSKFASRLSNIYAIQTSTDKQKQLLSSLIDNPNIAYIEYKPEVKLFEVPDDPGLSSQYYINITNMFDAWDIETGNATVVIGIVDSGTDLTHEDLDGKIAYNTDDPINGIDDDQDGFIDNYYGWDLSENNNNPQYDADFHGAKVAGIVAANTNNGIGMAGVGYNLKYLPVKTMNAQGELNTPYEGIIYAADQGADIIVCSWGGYISSAFGRDIVQYAAIDKGALVVAAAGNDADEKLFYPASYPEVLSVAATNINDQRWSGSSYGYSVDISAPGSEIYLLGQNNGYGFGNGTSYAAPIVGAIAGLIKSNRPHLNAEQIKQQLLNTTYFLDTIPQNVIFANKLGSGRVDGYAALTDTLISGVTLSDVEIIGDAMAGDTVYLTGVFTNHLQSAVINIEIESLHPDITPVISSINAGIINSGSSYIIGENEIPIYISEEIQFDQLATIKFTINDGARTYDRLHTFTANKSFTDITLNNLNATIPSNGRIGFSSVDPIFGNGIWLDNSRNMVWEAGLLYGNSSTQIMSCFLDAQPFSITKNISFETDINENVITHAEMVDTNKNNSMNIYIKQKVTAVSDPDMENTLLFEYMLINKSSNTYDDFHAGLFFDWDIEPLRNNHAYFNDEHQIAICENVVGNSRLFGIKLLELSFKHYAFELNGETEGIDITDGFTNEERWFALTTEREEAGLSTGDDVAHLVSTDGLVLEAGDSIVLQYVMTTANHESILIDQIQAAQQYILSIDSPDNAINQMFVYPNPFSNELAIKLPEQSKSIHIYDSKGQLVKQFQKDESHIHLNISNLIDGLYFLKVETKSGTQFVKKIIKNQ